MKDQIFLDYNSTTPVDPLISKLIKPFYSQSFGNSSSSSHEYGKMARKAVENARTILAHGLECNSDEIYFTSGATESINLAIKGIVFASNLESKHIVTLKTEHSAVLDTCDYVRKLGVKVDYLDVDNEGYVDIDNLESHIKNHTILVAVLHGNNEIGTINAIDEIGQICQTKGVPLLVDAAQTFGKIPISLKSNSISMLAGSAHKIYGPKGVGFLYKHRSVRLDPLIHGGGHEMGLRSGTLNVPGIVGLGAAYQLICEKRDEENNKLKMLTGLMLDILTSSDLELFLNGPTNGRLPGNLNICLKDVDADWLTTMLPNIAMARGSACTSETIQPSHVLRAIGISDQDADSSLRISIGRFTSEDEIRSATNEIIEKSKSYISKRELLAI